jgi:hypothetical protein
VFHDQLGTHVARQRRRVRRLDHRRVLHLWQSAEARRVTRRLLSFFHGDRTRILIATIVFCFSFLELLWFGAALSSVLRDAGKGGWAGAAITMRHKLSLSPLQGF